MDPADLDEDGEYYSDRAADARVLAQCFNSLKSAIVDWGLWGRAQAPFNAACDAMAQHMDSAAKELGDMSTGLHRSAAEYRNNEQAGEELARKIF